MAKCEICGREMLEAAGCAISEVIVNDKVYPRIRCGEERNLIMEMEDGERCHDCGALKGEYHHWNCDMEECPACHGQLIGCGCSVSIEY
jgi:hypothetical protein